MKKITLLFFMSLLSWCGYSQLALENFESNGNALPVGWQQINVAGPAQQWTVATHSVVTPSYGGAGHAAYIQKENVATGTTEDWLITKQFLGQANAQLRFQSRLTQLGDDLNTYRIMMHIGNTPLTTASYTEVQAWTELTLNPDPFQTDYLEKVVNLPASAVGQQVYLAFVMNGDNGDRWLVDDVMVVQQCLDPTNLVASAVGLNQATLTWNNPGGATQWFIDIVPALGAPTNVGIPYSGDSPYTATTDSAGNPLTENTDYKFYVRANCGGGNTSNWVGPVNFSTVALGESCTAPIAIASLPFSDTDNTSNYADNINGSPGASGCGSTNNYLNGNDVFYSYTATANGIISIDVTGNGAYSGIFVYTSCANVGVTCAGGATTGFTPAPLSIPTFSVTAGQTYYFVISTWADPQTTPYTLTIQQVNCLKPVGLPTTNIGMTSASLSWTNPGSATSWQVVVQDPGDGIPSGPGVTASTNTNFNATSEFDGTPLVASTQYEYYVRADCGNGTFSAWAGPYLFNTTLCDASAQCSYTFVMTDSFGDGWNGNTMTVSQNGIPVATIGSTFTGGLGPVSVTVPVCDGIPVSLFWNSGGNFATEVGVAIQNNFGQVIFNKPSGLGGQNSTLYTGVVNCNTPACLPPTGLAVTNISTDSVSLGWAGPATGNWDYFVTTAGSPGPTSSTTGVNTTTNPVDVTTGLTAGTNYVYYVRVVCDSSNNSAWAGPFAFTTAVCPLSEQCVYNFVMTDSFGDGWNGNSMTISQGGATVGVITLGTGSGPQTVSIPLCTNQPLELFWNAGGNFANEVAVSIVNNFGQVLFTKPSGTGSQNTMLFTTTGIDCSTPACIAPTGLTSGDYTVDSAMVGWDGPATGSWEVFVVPEGDPAPTASSTGVMAGTNPFEVSLPTPGTNYEFYVRLVCDASSSSDWAGPYDLHSMLCDPADQCNYVFELRDEFSSGWGNFTMSIFQGGIPVATIGEDFNWGTETMTVQVPLCPNEPIEIVWNTDGFPWEEEQVGLTVFTPFAEDIYVKDFGEGTPGTTIFTGVADCTPPPCPKPQSLFVDGIGLTEAMLHWTEMGAATNWEVYVVPINAPAPLPTDVGTATTTMPYNATETATGVDFTSGTSYDYYVRAICGGTDGNSTWSGPITFTTLIENDDCDTATEVEVNADVDCTVFATGTITGATGSLQEQSCITWMDIEYDVWYSFVATATTHAVNINNQVGAFFQTVIYEGADCGTLNQLACGDDSETISGLTIGNTYYVRVYTTFLNDPTDITSFEICVNTPPPPIAVSTDQYTIEELVQDVLIGSECAQITNVMSGTGESIGVNGIGYFTQNGSAFPMTDGVVLVTGDVNTAPGPNNFPGGTGNFPGWPGDPDLEDITGLPAGNSGDASWISFDFVTLIDELNFDFLFASEEYDQANFECIYSDSFAFILTDLTTGISTNLAVLPSTTIPIQVTNIHPDNGFCDAINENYFGQYNNTAFDPINFNGQTVTMTATSPVIPNHAYNIKLVIANATDHNFNSAVFLQAGSFNIGEPELGEPSLESDGNAVCSGGSRLLETGLDPDNFEFVWYQDGDIIPNATDTSYLVTVEGTYKVEATFIGSTCSTEGTIVVEFYDPVVDVVNDPENLTACNASGFDTFDLSQNTGAMLEGITGDYTITYHTTQELAESGNSPIVADVTAYQNTTQFVQTIYTRIYNNLTDCYGVKSFTITVEDHTPEFVLTPEFAMCAGTSGTITVDGSNYDDADVTFAWTKDGDPFAGTTSTITVTEAGVYGVTIDNNGCTATANTTVAIIPIPEADAPENVTSCDSYVLPALSANNNYYTEADGAGTMLNAGDVITETQDIHIFATTGTTPNCTDDNVFTVTIVTSPVVVTPGDQSACDSYTLPALILGNYFTGAAGTGTMLNAGDAVTATQTIYVYAQSGSTPNCTAEDTFVVTITPTPEADAPVNVTACDSYVLPALSAGNNYYTGIDGTGTMLSAGEVITGTQDIHVFVTSGTTPNCTDDNVFTITIVPSPVVVTPGNQSACDSYTLPALTVGNYFTGAGGTGTMLNAGEAVTTSQTIYVYAQSGSTPNCTDEDSFAVNIIPSPVADAPGDITVCDSYTLPSLGVGNYYTGPGGTGTQLAVGSTVDASQTVYVYAQSGTTPNCTDENSFTITVIPTPAIAITEGCNDDNVYVLEAIFTDEIYTPDNVTFEWTDASGASLGSSSELVISGVGIYHVRVIPNGDIACPIDGNITVTDTSCDVQRGISPNGDDKNQSFDLTALDVMKISIFNRYGQEVYSRGNGYTNQWEGQGKGGEELPTGTYFYMIERSNGESRTGWVYINRQN
ncbi:choice-of-anchor L domain-containing protein [Flavobacterium sp. DGU11]|uniref:Choice-of-anchor L domain-containing protein n=1 Tax=Flavobacterium arundinis TaxID=3139143 RepID=A0ABU9HYS3_9FLAO